MLLYQIRTICQPNSRLVNQFLYGEKFHLRNIRDGILKLLQGGFNCFDQLLDLDIPFPLLDDYSLRIYQEEMRLGNVSQFFLKIIRCWIVTIQVNKIDPLLVILLHSMHQRRHRQAGSIPKREEKEQLGFSGGSISHR